MEEHRLFVGNLSFDATEEELRNAFSRHGEVSRVNLVTDRDTGRSRGFAFVEMQSGQDARRAIADLNDTNLGGRQIQVSVAKPREARASGSRQRW